MSTGPRAVKIDSGESHGFPKRTSPRRRQKMLLATFAYKLYHPFWVQKDDPTSPVYSRLLYVNFYTDIKKYTYISNDEKKDTAIRALYTLYTGIKKYDTR